MFHLITYRERGKIFQFYLRSNRNEPRFLDLKVIGAFRSVFFKSKVRWFIVKRISRFCLFFVRFVDVINKSFVKCR